MKTWSLVPILGLGFSVIDALPTATPPSYNDTKGESSSEAKQRADAVKEAFRTAWDGYYKYEIESRGV